MSLAGRKKFDVIFLDVVMPGMDGFMARSRIQESTPNTQTPMVFVTSHNDSESQARAGFAGSCGFIPKPVLSNEIMVTALTIVLRGRLNQFETAPKG